MPSPRVDGSPRFIDEWLGPVEVIDVDLHMLRDDARYRLFDAFVGAGLDLRLEPFLLLAGEGDVHGRECTPFAAGYPIRLRFAL